MKGLFALLRKPNVVVVDTLPKAQLMNKLLLAKIAGLSIILAGLLKLAGWSNLMLALGALALGIFIARGYFRDIRRQMQIFGSGSPR
jgi:hypothetical protein